MSASFTFDWLSGVINVRAAAPTEWADKGLAAFYQHPNDPEWGATLCRELYHESIHFWQLLSSAYLANIVQAEWIRLQHFESKGILEPISALVQGFTRRSNDEPFSAYELMECWARYWDVHTRNPAQLVAEENIFFQDAGPLRTKVDKTDAYTSNAFDLFMTEGADARLYAAPYRWILEQCQGNSSLANLLFPILTFHAFGSPQPVAMFRKMLELELQCGFVRLGVNRRELGHSINFHWLNNHNPIIKEIVNPARHALGVPDFTGGWDVINRGLLRTHPVYRPYLNRLNALFRLLSSNKVDPPANDSADAIYQFALRDLAKRNPFVVFTFPGQPLYRLTLGQYIPPPLVRFTNIERSEDIQPSARLLATLTGKEIDESTLHFAPIVADLEIRVQNFRQAEYALSLGLSPDVFL